MKKSFVQLVTFGILVFVAVSCKKKDDTSPQPATLATAERSIITDDNNSDAEFDDLASVEDEALTASDMGMREEAENQTKLPSPGNAVPVPAATKPDTIKNDTNGESLKCATVIHDKNNRTITIDFGTTGCVGKDARTRKGKITIVYSGEGKFYQTVGNSFTTTYTNYEVDGIKINGKRTSTYKGENTIEIKVEDASLTYPDGKKITWKATRTRKQTAGLGTRRWNDDKFTINGTSEGVTREGTKFKADLKDLVIDLTCPVGFKRFPTSGTRTVSFGANYENSRTVDFGSGTCDLKLMVKTVGNANIEVNFE